MNTTPQKLKRWARGMALQAIWKLARMAYLWAENKRPAGGWFPKPTTKNQVNDGRKK
jgi:hypothetical protein